MCGHGWLFIKKTETVSFQLPVTSQCTHLYWGHLCFVLELQSKEGSSTCFFRPFSSYHCGQKVLDHFFYFSSVTHCIPCGPKWKQSPLPFPSHTPWKHCLTHHPPPTHYAPLSPLILDRLSEHWMSTGKQCYRWLLSSWLPQQHGIWAAFLPHGISSSPNKNGDTREQCLSDHSQGVFQDAGWTTPRVPLLTSVAFELLSHLLKQEFLGFESLHHFLLHLC